MKGYWPTIKDPDCEPLSVEAKLAYLIEECSEVQKECCKLLRFKNKPLEGWTVSDNWGKLELELADLELGIRIIREVIP